MLATLLINQNGAPISFISEKKLFKLLAKDKVELLAAWDEIVKWGRDGKNSIKHPAIVQLRHKAPWIPRKRRFNRHGIFKRDKFTCQYCSVVLSASKLTLDHVIPQTQGGDSSWRNCVTSCFDCNNKKGGRTPEQARMKLLRKPIVPYSSVADDFFTMKKRHQDWAFYLGVDPNAPVEEFSLV